MDDSGDVIKQSINDILPKNAVQVHSEPELVTMERLKNQRVSFLAVAIIAAIFIISATAFLFYAYGFEGTSDQIKDRIIIGFVAALSTTIGLLAGKNL